MGVLSMFYTILRGPPYATTVCDGANGCKLVTIEIASDGNRIVSVICELAEMDIEHPGIWEFSFAIGCFSLDDSTQPFETQDREIAARLIPNDIRVRVMEVVCECLKALINNVKPERVYQVTKQIRPPENALRKHHMLTATLESMGYRVIDEGTDPFDRRFWSYGVLTLVNSED
jgi:hypothetical protein